MSKKTIIHHACGQEMEISCSCCGKESHASSHPNCSLKSSRSCKDWWEEQEKNRLQQIEELSKPQRNRMDYYTEELANLKDYRDNKMANDTKTPQDIKDHICNYIINLEKRIATEKPQTEAELEEINKGRLKQIENYKPETYYSHSANRPPNTNCPHWRKYALNENNEPPTPPTNPQPNNIPTSNSYLTLTHSTNKNTSSNSNSNQNSNQQKINFSPKKSNPINEEINQNFSTTDNSQFNSLPESSKKENTPVLSPNLPKTGLNPGIIVFYCGVIVAFAISLAGYLIWKKGFKR